VIAVEVVMEVEGSKRMSCSLILLAFTVSYQKSSQQVMAMELGAMDDIDSMAVLSPLLSTLAPRQLMQGYCSKDSKPLLTELLLPPKHPLIRSSLLAMVVGPRRKKRAQENIGQRHLRIRQLRLRRFNPRRQCQQQS